MDLRGALQMGIKKRKGKSKRKGKRGRRGTCDQIKTWLTGSSSELRFYIPLDTK